MITEKQITLRIQTPELEGNWLWQPEVGTNKKIYRKEVYLGINAEPWPECTNAEKEQWESEEPQQEF